MSKRNFQVVIPDYRYWKQNIKCQTGCPVDTDSRGYVRAIAEGDYEKAYWIARMPNPLASICGRICGAPCELACRRGWIDAAISIRALKGFVSEKYGVEIYKDKKDFVHNFKPKFKEKGTGIIGIAENTPKPVSIVGSGPAGLACAHDLALMGYKPIIYEMEKVAGGMCAMGIPPYRLPREILQAEIDAIKALGAEIRLGVQIGKDILLKKLYDESEAVLLAAGARKSRMLPVEGSESKEVLGGIDFLRDVFTDKKVAIGPRVVVIGGGNVAYDVARTALRQKGVESVVLVCIEKFEEMLADTIEIKEGEEEGIERINSFGPQKINADKNGVVKSITFNRCIAVFDSEGRFNPRYDESDTMTLSADTIFFSIGQAYDLSFLDKCDLDIEKTERGMIKVGPDSISTSVPGLFVAGDLAYGPRLVIDAVASGKKAAVIIHEYLSGKRVRMNISESHAVNYDKEVSCNDVAHPPDFEKINREEVPAEPVDERMKSVLTPVETGFLKEAAEEQGGRCLNCAVNTIFNGDRCILCGGCADICPEYCLRLVSIDNIKGDETLTGLFKNRYGSEPAGTGSAIIKDEERCIRCGLCAQKCPVDAITMERFIFKEVIDK
ncbi:MAG: FAD-dependent oxidoreductase [Thermodesulfovibrionia bacterium]|nr:FAD-dependent oxidoreductase [Thermodesulfovibrionia bacterium]